MSQINLSSGPKKYEGQYEYEPLNNIPFRADAIRLIKLLPSLDTHSDIHCVVFQVSLCVAPSFDALSYVWGPPGDNCTNAVFLDQYPQIISNNLERSLRVLRNDKYPRHLWIDAICINQADHEEKNYQVLLMRDIYSKAKRVVIWLGDQASDSSLAMQALRSIQTGRDLSRISGDVNRAVGDLFNRPWFSRIWVVQEFTNGHNPLFMCGSDTFEWKQIEAVLGRVIGNDMVLLNPNRETNRPNFEVLRKLERGDIWIRLFMDRRRILTPKHGRYGASRSFLDVLTSHIDLDASVRHDKIYALLGLGQKYNIPGKPREKFRSRSRFSETDSSPRSLPTRDINRVAKWPVSCHKLKCRTKWISNRVLGIPPPLIDYDRSFQEVFTEWARWIIECDRNLDILFTIQKTQPDPGLPSWVPSWKIREDDHLVHNFSESLLHFCANKRNILETKPNLRFARSPTYYSFSEDNRRLSVKAQKLLVLDETFTFSNVQPEYTNLLRPFLSPTYLFDYSQTFLGRVRTLSSHFSTTLMFSSFTIWWDIALSLWRVPRDYRTKKRNTPARILKLTEVVTKNRKVFRGGKWNGLVPKQTKVGDVVCVIQGVQTPFVLRPCSEEAYVVVGECFVEGCMRGEKTRGVEMRQLIIV